MPSPDTDSAVTTYGGPFVDYRPVEDPTSDLSASQANPMMLSVAAMTHMCPRAKLSFTGLTYTSGTQPITVTSHDSMWGSAAPVLPTIGQTSAGVLTLTWPATVTDEYGNAHTLNIRDGWARFDGATPGFYTFTVASANTATLRLFNSAGSANAMNGTNITVYWL